ncbi:MAG: type III-A CRISPR-associated protein Csm2 [Caldilinea sp.]|jgi:CRISPR-associated protein Csm2
MPNISQNDIRIIITGIDADAARLLVKSADSLGSTLKNSGLTTSQIRSLFGEVRKIEAQWNMENAQQKQKALRRFTLLKPKMAYQAKRSQGGAVRELVDVLDPAVDLVVSEKDEKTREDNFRNFVNFFEAILAYHKAAGGR